MLGEQELDPKTSRVAKMIEEVKQRGNKLFYCVLYLSPSDYHRFHSPGAFTSYYRRHVPGWLEPVKPSYVFKHKDVFKNNERVNMFGQWTHGFFHISFVGALNVGSITIHKDPKIITNQAYFSDDYSIDKSYCEKRKEMEHPLES